MKGTCCWVLTASLLLAQPVLASEKTAKEEEELDKKLGLLDRPFRVNLAMLKTRTDLREAAKVRTGLPSYDQQVERAQCPEGCGHTRH